MKAAPSFLARSAEALDACEVDEAVDFRPATPEIPPLDAGATKPEPAPLRPGELLARFRRRLGKPQHPVVYYDPTVAR